MTLVTVKEPDRTIESHTEALAGKLTSKDEGEMTDYWASIRIGKEEFWLIVPDSWRSASRQTTLSSSTTSRRRPP